MRDRNKTGIHSPILKRPKLERLERRMKEVTIMAGNLLMREMDRCRVCLRGGRSVCLFHANALAASLAGPAFPNEFLQRRHKYGCCYWRNTFKLAPCASIRRIASEGKFVSAVEAARLLLFQDLRTCSCACLPLPSIHKASPLQIPPGAREPPGIADREPRGMVCISVAIGNSGWRCSAHDHLYFPRVSPWTPAW